MIDGERNRDAVAAEHGAGVAAVRNDDLIRSDDGDHGGGSDGVALRSLELAAAGGGAAGAVSSAAAATDFLVHF